MLGPGQQEPKSPKGLLGIPGRRPVKALEEPEGHQGRDQGRAPDGQGRRQGPGLTHGPAQGKEAVVHDEDEKADGQAEVAALGPEAGPQRHADQGHE